jgi:hypothetical protein
MELIILFYLIGALFILLNYKLGTLSKKETMIFIGLPIINMSVGILMIISYITVNFGDDDQDPFGM